MRRYMKNRWVALLVLAATTLLFAGASAFAAESIREGSRFPEVMLPAPEDIQEREYLGVKESGFFVQEVNAELLLLEIIGVYCPQCHRQAPLFNRLASRLLRNPATSGRVKLVALASGATPREMEYLKKEFKAPFPLIYEQDFSIHKQLGEPKTPFTILLRGADVVYTHLGVIEDMDELFIRIAALLP
jgi:hypothetical protein